MKTKDAKDGQWNVFNLISFREEPSEPQLANESSSNGSRALSSWKLLQRIVNSGWFSWKFSRDER